MTLRESACIPFFISGMEVLLKNHTLNETYLETILCLTFCVVFDLSYLCKR